MVSRPASRALPRVGRRSVARILRRVVFPAPFAPSKATASPAATARLIPRKAGEVGRVKGCRNARQPLYVGGNHFSKEETEIAGSVTLKFITCLVLENNRREGVVRRSRGAKPRSRRWQVVAIAGKIIAQRLKPTKRFGGSSTTKELRSWRCLKIERLFHRTY